MSVSGKTSKELWGRAAGQCAMCGCILFIQSGDSITLIGEEAHICSKKMQGPRYDGSLCTQELDAYDNLILLCRHHHKLVDDNVEQFPADRLRLIKTKHTECVEYVLRKLAEIRNSLYAFPIEPLLFFFFYSKAIEKATRWQQVSTFVEVSFSSEFDGSPDEDAIC